jgi:AAA+ superfamily predicted ATPase
MTNINDKHYRNKTRLQKINNNSTFKNIIQNIDETFKQELPPNNNLEKNTKEYFKQLESVNNKTFNDNNFVFPKFNNNYNPNEECSSASEERNKNTKNTIDEEKNLNIIKLIASFIVNDMSKEETNKEKKTTGENKNNSYNENDKTRENNSINSNQASKWQVFNKKSCPPNCPPNCPLCIYLNPMNPINPMNTINVFPNPLSFVQYNDLLSNINNQNHQNKNHQNKMIVEMETKNINVEINTLDDLIKMINDNPVMENVKYNIDISSINKIKPHLIELQNMIGMKNLKDIILDQILYFSQNLHKNKNKESDFMHTVIYGPPGTGKTEVAKILGKIFSKLGVLEKGTFKKATRHDLIAGYLGQTAMKTKELIASCLGGVLFIDEAYALGNDEKKDSFSKECIDTLCESLSDNKDKIMVIIAGYEKELNDCFFSYNQGLNSRFTWRFKTDDYNAEELMKIFIKKINESGWTLHDNSDINVKWFEENMVYFKFYGRDMEILFSKTKIAHGRRVFCKPPEEKKKIIKDDLDKGFKMFLNNDEVKRRKDEKEIEKNIKYSLYN